MKGQGQGKHKSEGVKQSPVKGSEQESRDLSAGKQRQRWGQL